MDSAIKIFKRPRLKSPSLIVGWEDAGFVGKRAIDYLVDELGAEEFGEIDAHDFALLPNSIIKKGVLQEIEYLATTFNYWKNKKSGDDLIIIGSSPPAIHHYKFANLILDVAELFRVRRIYAVGGLYASIAHTSQPEVFAIINHPGLKDYVTRQGIELGLSYRGPTSMNGLIIGLARQRNIEGICLWGRVPNYISDIPNPGVCRAVLETLSSLLKIDIDFSEMEVDIRRSGKRIEELVSYIRQQNPDLDQHIERLENGIHLEPMEEDSQVFFKDIEEFLRKQEGRRDSD
ncbi:PAC2 family protein [Chloroflexota bacterium]